MKMVVWLREGTWQACVAAASALVVPDDATLLHVVDAGLVDAWEGGPAGLLGRGGPVGGRLGGGPMGDGPRHGDSQWGDPRRGDPQARQGRDRPGRAAWWRGGEPPRPAPRPLGVPGPGPATSAAPAAVPETLTAASQELLIAAAGRWPGGNAPRLLSQVGRIEDVVLAALGGADLLVCARDGARDAGAHRPGPASLAPPTRFVVDHAPCAVLLVWPGES